MSEPVTIRPYEGRLSGDIDTATLSHRWKRYFSGKLKPYLGENVLEVGAGIGANTPYLVGPLQKRWLCLEPDPLSAERIPVKKWAELFNCHIEVRPGILQDLPATPSFDTIIYIDVLEHIEDDSKEMNEVMARLQVGGHIIILSPAYQSLYTGFDKDIGHFRRYNKKSLRGCSPSGSKLEAIFYLDSVGLLASIVNKLFLRQSVPPNASQVEFWDKYLVRGSIFFDRLIGYSAGKSIIGVWTKL